MKKRTTALVLVLIGPTLLAGCRSNDDCDPNTQDCSNRRGGAGGGYYGGGRVYGGGNSSGSSSHGSESGGFGATGRGFSGSFGS